MAILKGFPPSNTISPSVRITEKDFSFLDSAPSLHSIGLVGFATKGPINVPTLVTSLRELHTVFGFPHPSTADPYLIYAAEQALQQTNGVWIVRCAASALSDPEAALTAEVALPAAGGSVEILGNVAGPFTLSDDLFFRWRLNGILASKVLVLLENDLSNPTYTTEEAVDALNDQLSAEDGIQFFVSSTGTVGVKSTFSYGTAASIELVSVSNAMYGPASLFGLGTLMTAAAVTGTIDKYPNNSYQTSGNYNFSGFTNLYLHVVIDGTDNVNIDNIVQQVTISSTNTNITAIVNAINAQITAGTIPGGFIASAVGGNLKLTTLHHGRDAKVHVKSSSTAGALFGLSGKAAAGTSPSAVSRATPNLTYNAGIVTGSTAASTAISLTITADSPGTEGNLTQVVIKNDIREGHFQIQVFSEGIQVESWGQLSKTASSRFYVETFLALVSDYVRAVDNDAENSTPLDGTYSLAGGTNGIPADPDDQDTLLIGSSLSSSGLFALSEPEQVDIDLLAVPGHSSTEVVTAMLDLSQNQRGDCFAVIDPPFGLSVNEIIHWQNGTHPLNLTRFDSDFGALYWPWVKIRDSHNRIDVWAPPSGSVVATYVYSDNLSYPWFAPAGETRGLVFNITDVYTKPTLAERDLMYGNRNCINPIIRFNDAANFMIWGQKTLQRLPSALDRVNVRRMLLYIEKQIRIRSRRILFDPHDDVLRSQFIAIASEVLNEVQRTRGLVDYFVKCDEELNTAEVIDRNELRAKIGVQPIRAAEFVFIEFSVHKTGSFTENANTF